MYAHRNRNGCAALLYLYRSLYYFRTQILLHFYMYIVWHSKAFGNNTNGLRLCVSVVVGWLVVFFIQLPLLIFYLYRSKWMAESTINVLNCVRCTRYSFHHAMCLSIRTIHWKAMTMTTATTLKLLFAPSLFPSQS